MAIRLQFAPRHPFNGPNDSVRGTEPGPVSLTGCRRRRGSSIRRGVCFHYSSSMSGRVENPPFGDRLRFANPLNDGELAVWNALRDGLPVEWEIYAQPYVGDARPDFVLMHPLTGVVAVEVKHVDLAARGGEWVRNEIVRDCAQARRYKRVLKDRVWAAHDKTFQSRACVVYTRTTVVSADVVAAEWRASDAEWRASDALIPVFVLEELALTIAALCDDDADRDEVNHDKTLQALRHWLVEPEFSREQREVTPVAALSPKQREIAENPQRVTRRRVKGGAGSGKTLALAARAAILSREPDARVLVICFNRALVTYLSDLIAAYVRQEGGDRKAIVVYHWDGWWSESFSTLDPETQKRCHVPQADRARAAREVLEDGARQNLPQYDAVLVDEAQDLTPDHLRALKTILRDEKGGELLAFFDGAQDIYDRRVAWEKGSFDALGFRGQFFHLQENQRLPPRLAVIANRYAKEFLDVHDEDLLAVPVMETLEEWAAELEWIQCAELDLVSSAMTAVDAMFGDEVPRQRDPVAWADLVVATRHRDTAHRVAKKLQARELPVTSAIDVRGSRYDQLAKSTFYKGDGRIKISTIKSLKGFETTAMVIVVEPFTNDKASSYREVYTALTRLKRRDGGSSLTVVCAEPSLAVFGDRFGLDK